MLILVRRIKWATIFNNRKCSSWIHNIPCLKSHIVAINNPMNLLGNHREKCLGISSTIISTVHNSRISLRFMQIIKANRSIVLYIDTSCQKLAPPKHTRKPEKYKLQINHDYSQLIFPYRLIRQHKNTIRILGVYLLNINYHCRVKVS